MNMENTIVASNQKADGQNVRPDLVKRIGKTTYKVKAHFSKTSRETMKDKILRLLRNEVSQSP